MDVRLALTLAVAFFPLSFLLLRDELWKSIAHAENKNNLKNKMLGYQEDELIAV